MTDIVQYAEMNRGKLSFTFNEECNPVDFYDLPMNIQQNIELLEDHNILPEGRMDADMSGNYYARNQGDWVIQGPHTANKCVYLSQLGKG